VFYQGTEFITAVRAAMGDDDFFSSTRDWVDRHRHGYVRGRQLLRHWLRASDADLEPLYERYLDGAAVQLPFRHTGGGGLPFGATPQ
jgi:aminopeptidase N